LTETHRMRRCPARACVCIRQNDLPRCRARSSPPCGPQRKAAACAHERLGRAKALCGGAAR
jgi:hypothetical protein